MKKPGTIATGIGAFGFLAVLGLTYWASASDSIPIAEVSHIHGISVDQTDPSRLYLATHNGVWRTAADGTASRISNSNDDYMGFTPHPADSNIFYGSGHPQGGGNAGFIASHDAGATWESVSQGANGPVDFHAMDASAANPDVIYGLHDGVQVSRDGGKSWTVAGNPPAQVFDIAASSADENRLYAATAKGILVSWDGAQTWRQTGPSGQATMVQADKRGNVYAFVVGQGLIKAKDGEDSWSTLSNVFGDRVLLHLASDPKQPDRLYGVTQNSEIVTSSNGGAKWLPLGYPG